MTGVVVNIRVLHAPVTGAQRYVKALLGLLGDRMEAIAPARGGGMPGHLWEQGALPFRVGNRLLWSPSNTGPLGVARQVVTFHDVAPIDHPEWFSRRFALWFGWLAPRLARRVQGVIAVSSFVKERLLEATGIPEDKVVVIPNGVDAAFRPQPREAVEAMRRALDIPFPYLLTVGTLEARKNLRRLLAAWGRLAGRYPDIWLVVAGHRNPRLFRPAAIGPLPPRVRLVGHVGEALPALYSGALGFAYLSLYEGFGLPPLEAMAAGTPVLSSRATALPEAVGEAALTVDPEDTEAIIDGLERLLADEELRRRLREKGLERAQSLTWQRTAERTWRVLEALA